MIKIKFAAAALLIPTAAYCAISPSAQLPGLAAGAAVPAALSGPVPAAGPARAGLPLYGELPDLMLPEPVASHEGERVWLLPSVRYYKSEAEASLMRDYWRAALEKAGVKVLSAKTLKAGDSFYEFEIRYTGGRYLELYGPYRELFASEAGADAARDRAAGLLRKAGLRVAAALTARSGDSYLPMVYYLVDYRREEGERLKACVYRPAGRFPGEAAARERAALDEAAFAAAGLPVLGAEVVSGPKGSLYQLHYIGKESQPGLSEKSGFENAADAAAALAAETARLEASGAAVIEAKATVSSSWLADLHGYSVRYVALK